MGSIPQNVSQSTIRRNPHLYGVGAVVAPIAKSHVPQTALVQDGKKRKARKGAVAVVISLIAFRRRKLDDDSAVFACKPIRDGIAESLGVDDADQRIKFQYDQIETRGQQGLFVVIETLSPPVKRVIIQKSYVTADCSSFQSASSPPAGAGPRAEETI